MDRTELKSVGLYKEKGEYFLKIVYEEEDEKGVYKTTFPKVALDIPTSHYNMNLDRRDIYGDSYILGSWDTYTFLTRRGAGLELHNSEFGHGIKLTETVKEKTQELTLGEIEKRLGYKVKLVSKKKGDK